MGYGAAVFHRLFSTLAFQSESAMSRGAMVLRMDLMGQNSLTAVEVCAGAGGQALGLEKAGFFHEALVDLRS